VALDGVAQRGIVIVGRVEALGGGGVDQLYKLLKIVGAPRVGLRRIALLATARQQQRYRREQE